MELAPKFSKSLAIFENVENQAFQPLKSFSHLIYRIYSLRFFQAFYVKLVCEIYKYGKLSYCYRVSFTKFASKELIIIKVSKLSFGASFRSSVNNPCFGR